MTASTTTTTPNITLIPAKRNVVSDTPGGARKRVAAYCRVSTEQENQQNSYATQIA